MNRSTTKNKVRLTKYIKYIKLLPGLCFVLYNMVAAHAQTLNWAKSMGGIYDEFGHSVAIDGNGNVYMAGIFSSDTTYFDPSGSGVMLKNAGSIDAFLAKYDKSGKLLWAKGMGGKNTDYIYGVAIDGSGNVYVTGDFSSDTADFNRDGSGGKLINIGLYGSDVFLAKYDAAGNFLWVKGMGGTSLETGNGVAVDGVGNVYVTGYFGSASVNFNAGGSGGTLTNTQSGYYDVFLAKYDGTGKFLWAKSMGGKEDEAGNGIAVDGSGNVYVTGYFSSTTAEFNSGGSGGQLINASSGFFSKDIFLAKYDAGGSFLWAKSMGGSSNADEGRSVAVDGSGNVYITGNFNSGTAQFNAGGNGGTLICTGSYDVFLARYDMGGKFLWAKAMGGSKYDYGRSVTVDDSRNGVYVTGYFDSPTANFNPGGSGGGTLTSAGDYDAFLVKYDTAGSFVWARNMGGRSLDRGYGVATDRSGSIYATGSFNDTANFDPGSGTQFITRGRSDIYLIKLSDFSGCANGSSTTQKACGNYSFGGVSRTSSGTYTDTLVNAKGCDSVVTLHLTIIDTAKNTITDVACDSYTINNTTYTASGSYKQVHTSAGGCDSILTLNLTVHHSSDTTLTVQTCDSFFVLNDSLYTNSGTYTQVLTNSSGCDSAITLQLDLVGSPKAIVTQSGETLKVDSGADRYQWVDCNNGYAPIAGATGLTFNPDQTGNYAVVAASGDCSDTSDCYKVEVDGSSMEELGEGTQVQVYPNPVSGKMIIVSERALQGVNIRLINVVGQVMTEQAGQNGQRFELNMEEYASGMYWVEIRDGAKVVKKKVIRE